MTVADLTLIDCDLEGFKKLAAEFLKSLSNAKTVEQVDAGVRCLGVAYFDMKITAPSDGPIAVSVLDYATRKAADRIVQLTLNA